MPENLLEEDCPTCSSKWSVSFGESSIQGNYLVWYTSSYCANCGHAEEADGRGKLPDDLRQIELEMNGTWQLRIISLGEKTSSGMKALNDAIGLTYQDVARIRDAIPVDVVSGTKTEMLFYKEQLVKSYNKMIAEVNKVSKVMHISCG